MVSLLATAVANTAANRRLTFGISGRSGSARQQFKGLIAFGIGLALTSGALAALGPAPGRLAEVSVLIAANLVATVLRFLLTTVSSASMTVFPVTKILSPGRFSRSKFWRAVFVGAK